MSSNIDQWARAPPSRPTSTTPAYNPYGRGQMKFTGSSGGFRPSQVFASDERLGFRRVQDTVRKFISSWTNAPIQGGPSMVSAQTIRFVLMCTIWYTTSALSSNTGKVILNRFRYPVTLTIVQFAFVSAWSFLCMSPVVRMSKLRQPTRAIINTTLPMGLFQVGGHIFSSLAISRIPVSTVHTIKALSPLFTVAAYALLFGVSYSGKTYFSLLPLTLGVMLACSFDMSASNVTGLACAFGSALVFVTSNIFFKKVMPSTEKGTAGTTASAAHKLDKLNLLFYSSTMAFVLMIPIWLWTDLPALWAGADAPAGHPSHGGHGHGSSLAWAFFANGTVHFAQNAIAFIILASTSPVTYSIASLVKRVAVICIAISWFAQPVHPIQAVGICLTSVGLWLYNGAKGDVAAGERRVRRVERARDLALPSTKAEVAAEGGMLGNSTRMATMMADPVPPPVYVAPMSMASGSAPPPPPTGVRGRRGSVRVPLPPPIVTRVNMPNTQSIVAVGGGNTPTDAKSPATGLGQRPVSYPSPPDSLDSPPPEHAYDLQHMQAEEGPLRATAVAMR